jgi:hypothetical protein
MHTGPTHGKPIGVATAAQPQMSIAVGGLPALSPPAVVLEPAQHSQLRSAPAMSHEAAENYQRLHAKYTIRLEDGTKAAAYSATPSPTRKRRQGQRRIQRGEPRHSTPGSAHHSPTKSPSIPDGTVSVPLPQYDLGGGFSLQQRAPLYLPTRLGYIVPDRHTPVDDHIQTAGTSATHAGRETIARQTLVPAVGSPQLPATDGVGGINISGGGSCNGCAELHAELQRMASLLAAEQAKKKVLIEGLGAARAEIKQQQEQLMAKDAEIQAMKQSQPTADLHGKGRSSNP